MSDLINRKDALCFDASQSILIDDTLYVPYLDWYFYLSNLPSAEPEQRKGSEYTALVIFLLEISGNCGADMRGDLE